MELTNTEKDIHIHTYIHVAAYMFLCSSAFLHAPVSTAWSIIARHRRWISSQPPVSQTPITPAPGSHLAAAKGQSFPHLFQAKAQQKEQRLFTTTMARSSESPLTIQPQQNLLSYRYCMLKSHRNLTKWPEYFSVTVTILIFPG